MDDVNAQLAAMKANWKKNRDASKAMTGGGGTTLEVGPCEVVWAGGRIISYNDALAVVMEFDYAGDDAAQQGRKGVRFCGLDTDEKVVFFLGDLRRMECQVDEIDDPEQIKDILKELDERKPHMRATVKKKGDYLNFYLDKLISNENDTAPAAEEAATDQPENLEQQPLKAGDKIEFQYSNKTHTGIVDKILDDDETLKVKCDQLKGRILTINVADNKVEMLVG
jgi:hypothetical protein